MKKKIEKEWCTYGSMWIWGFGKITNESYNSVNIKYLEGQLYSDECWDPSYVKRFDTLEEAAKHYQKYCGHSIGDSNLKNKMMEAFPSYFKGEKK